MIQSIIKSHRQYVKRILLFELLCFIIIVPLVYKFLFIDRIFAYQSLYAYQISKLKSTPTINTVFLGDSSLGNTIDTEKFNSLSGLHSVNLALTGMYGFAGSYNMLKKASKGHTLKNVILVQSIDILPRNVAYDGYLYTIGEWSDFTELSGHEKIEVIECGINIFLSYVNLKRIIAYYILGKKYPYVIENDYIKQGDAMNLNKSQRKRVVEDNQDKKRNNSQSETVLHISQSKIVFLKKIARFCEDRNINLIYIHGPVSEEYNDSHFQNYIKMINTFIKNSGITMIENVLFIPSDKIGDNFVHVHPNFKEEFTHIYFNALRHYLEY